jgi:hypothetical protein
MDALAAESFLNAPHTVCGRRMLPLSVGHAFTLEAIGSPFYHGQLGSEAELRLAAWICSRPPLILPKMDGWRCRLWLRRKIDFVGEVARWKTYVADYCAPPQMWNKTPKAGEPPLEPSAIPTGISTVVRLMRLGMTEKQAWSTPVGVATWYEAAAYETENGARLDIVTDSERLAIARAKARQAAAPESEAKNG